MRNLKGYVFITKVQYGKRLFGRGTNQEGYKNFEVNGLVPYEMLEEAEAMGRKFLVETRDAKSVTSARIKMEIAENEKEFERFETETGLIAIMKGHMYDENWWKLLGPIVEGKRCFYPLPGAFLGDTDFTTFKGKTAYQDALYLAKEINRQAQCPATIATFKLERITSFMKKRELK